MAKLEHDLDKVVEQFAERARDFSTPLKNWYGYMLRRTQLTFQNLGKKGSGTFRGVSWPWFADQYTRKTDGVTVPAEGGVPRVRSGYSYRTKKGKFRKGAGRSIETREMTGGRKTTGGVWGRLRHSKTRVTSKSRLLQDRGVLKAAALSRFRIRNKYLIARTPTNYARFINKVRPFVFITDDDTDVLVGMIEKYLAKG